MHHKVLLYACGVLNAAFTVFHVYLAMIIHRLPALSPSYRALMEALNLGGILMIGFLAFAYLACQSDLDGRLGRATAWLGGILYLSRGLEEYVMFPARNPMIMAVCVIAGVMHLASLYRARPAAV